MSTCRKAIAKGAAEEAEWKANCVAYKAKYPKEWAEFEALTSGKVRPITAHTAVISA